MSERLQTCQCNKSTTDSSVSNHSKLLDKNRKPLVSRPPLIQTKLTINQPGDEYEQEADRVAEQVMRVPDPVSVPQSQVDSQPEGLSIQSITRYPEKDIQRKEDDQEEEGIVQMKQVSPSHAARSQPGVPPIVHEVLSSPGVPLDSATRAYMEPRFGYDFSRVRVHTGVAAEQSAREVNANAYTLGHDIVFGQGGLTPGTHEGRRLIAHELTHVVQQSRSDGIHLGQKSYERCLTSIPTRLKLQRQQSDFICTSKPSKDLSPGEWIRCRNSGHIKEDNEYPLRFSGDGVVMTGNELVAWMTREGKSEKNAISSIMGSRTFAGTKKAREEARAQLVRLIPREKLSVCIRPVQIADSNGKKPTILPSFEEAKAIWGKCCIDLSVKDPKIVSKTAFKTLDHDDISTAGKPTAEESSLINDAGGAGGCISVFVAEIFKDGNNISKDIGGGAGVRYAGGTDLAIFTVENVDPTVVAHELGHAMGYLSHDPPGTVMKPTAKKHNQKESDKVVDIICNKVRTFAGSKTSSKKDCYLDIM